MIFVGVDWAEAHHDVHVMDEDAKRLGSGRLPEGVEGIARFHELVGAHAEDPGEVVIGIETDRGLFVAALIAAGYLVFAVNPMSTSRYRDRHSSSGAKSDPGDAKVLAHMDRHNHRPVAGDSEGVEAVKVLARAHQSMIWSRGRQTNALRSTLREFYPAALVAFDDLASGDATEVLKIAPTPGLGATLSLSKIASALRRGGRQRRIDERSQEIQTALRAPQLQGSAVVANAMGASVKASVTVISTMTIEIANLAEALEAGFEQHPASSGMTRTAMPTPSLARTTPARRQSRAPRARSTSCLRVTSAICDSPTRSISGRSPRSPRHREHAPITTPTGRPATPTTKHCGRSGIGSSASFTDASPTAASTTSTPPGATGRTTNLRWPLDKLEPWDI
jgi:hypothetical protein